MPPTTSTPPSSRSGPDTSVSLRLLTATDATAAAGVIVRAFDEDAVLRLLLPDAKARRRMARWMARWYVRVALPYASVWGAELDGRLQGVAVWHPPGVSPGSLQATRDALRELPSALPALVRLPTPLAATLVHEPRPLLELLRSQSQAGKHAASGPAWYLAYLAVDPDAQGRGLARLLLDHVLTRCDEDGTAAWLQTTDPRNPPLYERFGFHTTGHVPPAERLPGVWVMRREPVAADGARAPAAPADAASAAATSAASPP